jgi:Asp-tRNA(Asn)/Glu-tRNA(Gln) amidotransferase A subunit family amidase
LSKSAIKLASTVRQPLSVLDSVPFAVKDNIDAEGYHTRAGTTFLHKQFDHAPVWKPAPRANGHVVVDCVLAAEQAAGAAGWLGVSVHVQFTD